MLFQPSNIYPDVLSGFGAGVVDANTPAYCTWQVNGTSPMTAFKIDIFENDAASTQIYTTSKRTLTTPFNGTDAKGNPQSYTFFFGGNTWAGLPDATISNGNEYKLSITQYYSDGNGNDVAVTQYSASVFSTRSAPSVALSVTTTSISAIVSGAYTQAEGDAIAFVRWVFASGSSVIEDTGEISTGVLNYVANGLLPDTEYTVTCYVTTVSGQTCTAQETVTVTQTLNPLQNSIVGKWTDDGAVELSWGNVKYYEAQATGAYSLSNGMLTLPVGSTVAYNAQNDPIVPTTPYSFFLRTRLDIPFNAAKSTLSTNITCAAVSSDGSTVAIGYGTSLEIRRTSDLDLVQFISLDGAVYSVCFVNSYTDFVVGGAFTNYIKVYHKSGSTYSQAVNGISGISDAVRGIAQYSDTYHRLIVCGDFGATTAEITYSGGVPTAGTKLVSISGLESTTFTACAANNNSDYALCGNEGVYVLHEAGSDGSSALDWSRIYFASSCAVGTDYAAFVVEGSVVVYDMAEETASTPVGLDTNALSVFCLDGNISFCALCRDGIRYFDATEGAVDGTYALDGNKVTRVGGGNSDGFFVSDTSNGASVVLTPNTMSVGTKLVEVTFANNDLVEIWYSNHEVVFKLNGTVRYRNNPYVNGQISLGFSQNWVYLGGEKHTLATNVGAIQSIVLYGPQVTDFLVVYDGADAEPPTTTPSYSGDIDFFASYDDGTLDAGIAYFTNGYVFRTEDNAVVQSSVLPYSVTGSNGKIRDYGVRACTGYTYSIYFSFDNGASVSQKFTSETFKAPFGGVYLYEAKPDETLPNVFHVVKSWKFKLGYDLSALSNGNTPSFYENFTPYRTRQRSRRIGRTGTLTAYLGSVSDYAYKDTVAMMDELFRASLSTNCFFLKDPKGNLMQVHTSSAVTEQMTFRSLPMQVKVTVPFEEIGDASNVSLIQVETDFKGATNGDVQDQGEPTPAPTPTPTPTPGYVADEDFYITVLDVRSQQIAHPTWSAQQQYDAAEIVTYKLSDYICYALVAEMSPYADYQEALRAQAIAIRSFIFARTADTLSYHKGAMTCNDYNHCMAALTPTEYATYKANPQHADDVALIEAAQQSTSGLLCMYAGKIASTSFHSCAYKRTVSYADYYGTAGKPYLVSAETYPYWLNSSDRGSATPPGDDQYSVQTVSYDETALMTALTGSSSFPGSTPLNVVYVNYGADTNTVKRVNYAEFYGVRRAGRQIRSTLKAGTPLAPLKSTSMDIVYDPTTHNYEFTVYGSGHGIGMSQAGAKYMAQYLNKTYDEILAHYYQGISIAKMTGEMLPQSASAAT